MPKDKDTIGGWQIAEKEVRQLASTVGIPKSTILPEVIVVGKKSPKKFREWPSLYEDSSGISPSGYYITIPEVMLKKVDKSSYVLGSRTEQNIRHELAHFIEHLETGTHTGPDKDPYIQVVKEIRADLRGGTRSMSRSLALQIKALEREYGLPKGEALEIAVRAARSLDISRSIISRSRKLFLSWGK